MKLICYLSNGYPTIDDSIEMAKVYSDAGCDVIEVDFPSHNPYLEGEFIAGRMKDALIECDDYEKYMEGIKKVKQENTSTQILLLAYDNTIEKIGEENFIRFCRDNNLKDMIYVGKNLGLQQRLIDSGLRISCYVQFDLPINEVIAAQNSNGFVYMQAKPTMDKINPKYPTLKDCITYLKSIGIQREIYCGVGIKDAEDIGMAKESGADGVFVGSTILKLHGDNKLLKETIKALKEAT